MELATFGCHIFPAVVLAALSVVAFLRAWRVFASVAPMMYPVHYYTLDCCRVFGSSLRFARRLFHRFLKRARRRIKPLFLLFG